MRTTALMLALATGVVAGPSAQTAPAPADLVQRIQAHYDSVRDYQADFEQTYRGKFTPSMPAEHGRLMIKKPGRMYVKYEGRDKKEFWADGVRYYQYFGSTKQGQSAPLQKGNDAPATFRLLLGEGNLVRDFATSMAANQPPDQWRLALVPKQPDPNLRSMVLIVDRATLKLVGLEKIDSQEGTETWRFSNLKENVGLADREFNKSFPAGTNIIK